MTRVLLAADTALLVEVADLDAAMRLQTALRRAQLTGVTELVPAARTILVRFDPHVVSAAVLGRQVLSLQPSLPTTIMGEAVTIPVHYDGADLDEVARQLDTTVNELVERHQAASWTVAFTGFAPGFGYLVTDDPIFDVPRRATPRTRIPAGSVGLAGRYSGVYPKESPGGWQLIGRTDMPMWDIERDPPALLAPGTAVRFTRTDRQPVPVARTAQPAAAGAHAVEVVRSGLQLLVQDEGRIGRAGQGVSAAGSADRAGLREANRAVGNAPGTAGLELVGGGASLRFRGSAVVALTGARAEAVLVAGEQQRAVAHGRAFAIDHGEELRIGAVRDGWRVLLAIRGGIALDPVLNSLSTDTLAQLGPAPLLAGDVLPLHGPRNGATAVAPTHAPRIPLPKPGETVELGIVLGPRHDWFTEAALSSLLTTEWEVTTRSDRVGLRLTGEVPLERARTGELESEGAVTGAIQVPPDGQPVLFLPDHPLTGGYPVIGAVIDRDLDRAGQLPPGSRIRFRVAVPGAATESV